MVTKNVVKNAVSECPEQTDIQAENLKPRRRSTVMTREKLFEQIGSGLGQGFGSDYQPWLKIRRKNVSPISNQVVSFMPPLGRTAHYFSRGEFHTALLLLWLGVIDLREQFPLWPTPHPHPLDGFPGYDSRVIKWSRGMLAIADDAGIKHGVEFGTKIPYVATLDLMATVPLLDGVALVGFSSKSILDENGTLKERSIERLELERRYMAEMEAKYFVTSSSLVPLTMAGQLESWLDCSTFHFNPALIPLVDGFVTVFNRHKNSSLVENVERASRALSIDKDSAWLIFRHCAWNLKIDIDPTIEVNTLRPMCTGGKALRSKLRNNYFGGDWS